MAWVLNTVAQHKRRRKEGSLVKDTSRYGQKARFGFDVFLEEVRCAQMRTTSLGKVAPFSVSHPRVRKRGETNFPVCTFRGCEERGGKTSHPNHGRTLTKRPSTRHQTIPPQQKRLPLGARQPFSILPNRHRRRGGAPLGRSRPERRFPSTVRTVLENERGAQCVFDVVLFLR